MLVDLMLHASRQSPQTLAVSDGQRALSYRQLTRLAAVLRRVVSGATDGERVGIMLPASTAFPATLFGVLWSSRVAVPLNFLLSGEELAAIVEDAQLDLILTSRHFEPLAADLPARVLFLEDLPLKRKMAWSFLRRFPATPHVDPHATAVILYTSGTTAAPKGVELTHNNLYRNCIDTIHSLNIDQPQGCLNILPPFHVFGLTANVLVPVALGASVYAIPRFNPAAVVRTIERERIAVILAIPSMYAALLRSKSATRDSFRSVQLAMSGGEPLPDGVRKGFHERFGVTLREGYGMTETSPIISACSVTSYREGSVGRPIRNVEVRITGQDGDALPPDEDGEILVRGPTVMKGYYGKPEETRKILSDDGWLATGDVGHLDADGFLTITGRAKEMMIVGGENVFPREIEAALENHEGVLQVAVIGVRDDLRGEVPVAFVVPRSGARVTEQELRSHVKRSLAGFKIPRQIIIREDLPTSPTGKILKRCLSSLLVR